MIEHGAFAALAGGLRRAIAQKDGVGAVLAPEDAAHAVVGVFGLIARDQFGRAQALLALEVCDLIGVEPAENIFLERHEAAGHADEHQHRAGGDAEQPVQLKEGVERPQSGAKTHVGGRPWAASGDTGRAAVRGLYTHRQSTASRRTCELFMMMAPESNIGRRRLALPMAVHPAAVKRARPDPGRAIHRDEGFPPFHQQPLGCKCERFSFYIRRSTVQGSGVGD